MGLFVRVTFKGVNFDMMGIGTFGVERITKVKLSQTHIFFPGKTLVVKTFKKPVLKEEK